MKGIAVGALIRLPLFVDVVVERLRPAHRSPVCLVQYGTTGVYSFSMASS